MNLNYNPWKIKFSSSSSSSLSLSLSLRSLAIEAKNPQLSSVVLYTFCRLHWKHAISRQEQCGPPACDGSLSFFYYWHTEHNFALAEKYITCISMNHTGDYKIVTKILERMFQMETMYTACQLRLRYRMYSRVPAGEQLKLCLFD